MILVIFWHNSKFIFLKQSNIVKKSHFSCNFTIFLVRCEQILKNNSASNHFIFSRIVYKAKCYNSKLFLRQIKNWNLSLHKKITKRSYCYMKKDNLLSLRPCFSELISLTDCNILTPNNSRILLTGDKELTQLKFLLVRPS